MVKSLRLMRGRAICFDCDGVLHKYSKGYQDGSIYDDPIMPMVKLISLLQKEGFPVFICSTRKPEQIIEWWNRLGLGVEAVPFPEDVVFWTDKKHIGVTNIKKPAQIYIDDHAYAYRGQNTADILADFGIEEELCQR